MSRLIKKAKVDYNEFIESNNLDIHNYQRYGMLWCLDNELTTNPFLNNKHGGFLADEMGLGKTIMMLSLMYVNKQPKTLIVVPPPLVRQWEEKVIQLLKVVPSIVYGYNKHKLNINESEIVITTYGNLNCSTPNIQEQNYDRIIFDEAHHLKNKSSECYKNAQSLKSRIKWLITGTPLQNKMKDIYNLAELLNLDRKLISKNLETFKKTCILHRKKENANIMLPALKEFNIEIDFENIEEKKLIVEMLKKLLDDRQNSLVHMIRQRQMCIVPSVLNRNIKEIYNVNDEIFEKATSTKSKINKVVEKIYENRNNNKGKIIFCHFKKEIDTIKNELVKKGCHEDYILKIDGRLTTKKKNEIFSEQDGNKILIMQIQSCSEGLNLQMFSEIYFVSPHWNPCVEEQAIARCHRLGQRQEVHVYKFKMKYTIEEYILGVQNVKLDLRKELF